MKYKKVFSALAEKNALEVYMYIYYRCTTGDFASFEEISKEQKMNKSNLRRITNRLSRCKLIKSIRPIKEPDGRRRVYIVESPELAEIIRQVYTL